MLSNSTGQMLKTLDDTAEKVSTYHSSTKQDKPPSNISFPLKNVSVNAFDFRGSSSLNISYHSVLKLKKFNPAKINNNYYFKSEKTTPNPILYVLEAAAGAYYEIIAPDYVPAVRAAYNEELGEYVGVVPKEIPGFQSLKKRPLTREDIYISPEILNNFSIPEMETLDLQTKASATILENKKLDEIIARKKIKIEETITVPASSSYSLSSSIMWVIGKNAPPVTKTVVTEKEIVFTVKDLLAYRTIKGNAIGTALSSFCGEEDFHTENGSAKGERIDFDMSFWDYLCAFKPLNIFESKLRPGSNCNVSKGDIVNCPECETSKPMYGPTRPEPIFEHLRTAISSITPVAQNAFPESQRKVYAELKSNPIYIYHKYKTWLKCLLLDQEMILNNNKLHIPPYFMHEAKHESILESFSEHEYQRGISFRNIMVTTQQFQDFMTNYGDFVFECIKKEFATRNAKYQNKEKYKNANILINMDTITKRFEDIKLEIKNQHTDSIHSLDCYIENKLRPSIHSIDNYIDNKLRHSASLDADAKIIEDFVYIEKEDETPKLKK